MGESGTYESEIGRLRRCRILIHGIVQGVGFRPFVFKIATELHLIGWVCNTSRGVVVEIQGEADNLKEFIHKLQIEKPSLAQIDGLDIEYIPIDGSKSFEIKKSEEQETQRALIPADIATCPDCLREMNDPQDRRYHYPFTNCTNCGPRYSIIEKIPYDRPNTTMKIFQMCPDCQAEYENPLNRRFHAQPNACPVCGPKVWLDGTINESGKSIIMAGELLKEGKILAIKGLGGFHLACDARNGEAVAELRKRKGRGGKPFALMSQNLEEISKYCRVTVAAVESLTSPIRPIVLLEKKENCDIAEDAAADNKFLGVMLPYTPLHHILFEYGPKTLVMTSGNLSEEPICYKNEDAKEKLGHIADYFLMHNRDIFIPCDDSVVQIVGGESVPLRRSRGYTPRHLELDYEARPVLACGGEQKSTFCITYGSNAVLSQHIGDLDNAETLTYYEKSIQHFKELFKFEPEIIAYDMHPEYLSTKYAKSTGISKKVGIQHHHAHITSCMVDNRITGDVLGVAFDGTGYGTDGTIWGGEFLIANRKEFTRIGHVKNIPLPGGSISIKKPVRMGIAYLYSALGEDAFEHIVRLFPEISVQEIEVIIMQMERGLNSPLTSSAGRLFDAVSAILGVRHESTYEGEAAMALQGIAHDNIEETYTFDLYDGSDSLILDPSPVIKSIITDRETGINPSIISAKFHNSVAGAIVETCRRLSYQTGINRVALSGGVFQNSHLLKSVLKKMDDTNLTVYTHKTVPPNDGGISLGQAAIASELA